jgi:hypothetical protein
MVKGIHIVHEGSEANSWKALNRHRFASDAEQLAVWLSATNILGPVHPQARPAEEGSTPTGEQVKPVA